MARFFFGQRLEARYEVGGRIRSWSPDGSQPWGDNVILECDPPRRLVHSWRSLYDPDLAAEPESRVTWEIEAVADGLSRLTVIHDRLDASPENRGQRAGVVVHPEQLEDRDRNGRAAPADHLTRRTTIQESTAKETIMSTSMVAELEIAGTGRSAPQSARSCLFGWPVTDARSGCFLAAAESGTGAGESRISAGESRIGAGESRIGARMVVGRSQGAVL